MLDYYGLPKDTPGYQEAQQLREPYDQAAHVEHAMAADIDDTRFIPFLALHETEAWVMAAAQELADLVDVPELGETLQAAVEQAGGAELVNQGPTTAPSKRILRAHPEYQKIIDGPDAIDLLGLAALSSACPHLAVWLDRLCGL